MSRILSLLLPARADNTPRGGRLPAGVFAAIAVVSLVRSCIHIFAPDGGAHTIAGIDLPLTSAGGIIFAFALWGSSQLVYALVQLAVAFCYRSLVPAMYVLLMVEALLRMLVGRLKPVRFSHTPPGAIGDYLILALAALMLWLSFRRTPGPAA